MEPLHLRAIRKSYPSQPQAVQVLDGITLSIQPGELFFLLGPSGCGKTTLLRCLAGLDFPTSGAIFFGERDVTNLAAHLRETAMVFQSYALWPHLNVEENIAFGLVERKTPTAERTQRVEQALRSVRLEGLGGRAIDQLSGGQQQRVALARALVVRPRCLLLDEPLSNLDAQLRIEMRREIRRIVKENGLTAVYVTHDQEEALAMADRMAILEKGVVAQVGTPEEIYRRPASASVARFIGETNLIPAELLAADAGHIRVNSAAGVFTGQGAQAMLTAAAGTPVTLSVRPEAWQPAAVGAANSITGQVMERVYLGARAQLTLASPLGPLSVVILNPPAGLTTGQTLTVAAAAQDIVVLPHA
ncbi:MAG: ABC transporter ATP-binding protein [Verrucomicrobiota bacterium]